MNDPASMGRAGGGWQACVLTQVKAAARLPPHHAPMPSSVPRSLSLRALSAAEVDTAFVLMRLDAPDLTLDDWRIVAARPVARGRILAAWDGALLKGLAFHSPAAAPDGETLTRIDRLIAFDMIDPRAVADALVAELARRGLAEGREGLGVAARCDRPDQAVTLALSHGAGSLHRIF